MEYKILGVNRRSYPSSRGRDSTGMINDDWSTEISVVLVAGEINDYAAYAGQGPDQWVAAHGDKISFNEACIHFPGGQLVKERYRD